MRNWANRCMREICSRSGNYSTAIYEVLNLSNLDSLAHPFAGLGRHGIDDGADERPRREVLPRSLGRLHGVFVEEPLVGVALDVRAHARPVLLVDEVDEQPPELGGVLELVLRLAKDETKQALLAAQGFEDVAIVIEKLVAVTLDEALPAVLVQDDAFLVVRLLRALVRHFEEEQIGELLDIIAVTHPVVAEDVTVVPEFLDDGGGGHSNRSKISGLDSPLFTSASTINLYFSNSSLLVPPAR